MFPSHLGPFPGDPACHYRWKHAQHNEWEFSDNKTCNNCVCFICHTHFGEFGCTTQSHLWAAPSEVPCVWPVAARGPAGGDDTLLSVLLQTHSSWLTFTAPVPHPGLRIPGVPDVATTTYMKSWCDGSVVHLLQAVTTPQNQDLFRLLFALSPVATVTKQMVGNEIKHVPTQPVVPIVGYVQGDELRVAVLVQRSGGFRVYFPGVAEALARLHRVTSVPPRTPPSSAIAKSADGSELFTHQWQCLMQMMSNEEHGFHTQMWSQQGNVHVSRFGDCVAQPESPYYRLPDTDVSGGVLCMPMCSGKTRIICALIASHVVPRTLVVVHDAVNAEFWQRELSLFGIAAEIEDGQNNSNRNTPGAAVLIITWKTLQTQQHCADRVVYDEFLRFIHQGVLSGPVMAPCVWGLTRPEFLSRFKPQTLVRFLFSECGPKNDAVGHLRSLCAQEAQDSLAHTVLHTCLLVTGSVPAHILPAYQLHKVEFEASAEWMRQYSACLPPLAMRPEALRSNVFLGAVAGSHALTANDLNRLTMCTNGVKADVQCAVCLVSAKEMKTPHQTPCGHTMCYDCIVSWIGKQMDAGIATPTCPVCRATVGVESLQPCMLENNTTSDTNCETVLPANAAKIDKIVQAVWRCVLPRVNVVVLSRFRAVRGALLQRFNALAKDTSVCTVTHQWEKYLTATTRANVLVSSPDKVLDRPPTCEAQVIVFAEPCLLKTEFEHICKRLTRLGCVQKDVSVFVVTTSGTLEEQLVHF